MQASDMTLIVSPKTTTAESLTITSITAAATPLAKHLFRSKSFAV